MHHSRKSAGVTNNINDDSVLFSVPLNPETEAAKWNSAIINFISYTCAFHTLTCQNVFCE